MKHWAYEQSVNMLAVVCWGFSFGNNCVLSKYALH